MEKTVEKTNLGVITMYTVMPVSNIMEIGGSVLPERFVSGSQYQGGSIVGDDLGSTSLPILPFVTIVRPNTITA